MKLFLKGDRCYSDKCAFDRRSYAPGQHGQRRRGKVSDYGIQLREKQKVKRLYGLSEKQFRLFFSRADRQKGITGTNLLVLLERRLDNVVYRLGFVNSRSQGRQFVRHNHFLVNGKKVNIPSYMIQADDVVEVRDKSKKIQSINDSLDAVVRRGIPQWLELEKENFRGMIKGFPVREDITMPIQEQLIVELYSK
ncbi:SSU ribosomal protein S4p (S9e) @ SSU ribosomal protein S4p (S9e), zinc-dependent [Olavius algarvensis associated proteobacterium Delta 3]|nr:SSU ribosomal protein S4p (S9e) @ SSU ribosomal protein S4p (S9e), zinc-dependent [Olavius algarvensis associated proteobacterium Delta 3]CAB5122834.1 SSU ribosomal protein S4p (S9e) @ SSU ribosomal protein S4p (S9e), zinc-dependent [Olavius algarvensis associated proteobacterium Delta 3]